MLLKHHDLGHVALSLIEQLHGDNPSKIVMPRALMEILKVVSQARWSLIKVIFILNISLSSFRNEDLSQNIGEGFIISVQVNYTQFYAET